MTSSNSPQPDPQRGVAADSEHSSQARTDASSPVDTRTIALFDLDRTLHRGSSLAVLARHAFRNDLVSKRTLARAAAEESRFRLGRSSKRRLDEVAEWALRLSAGTDMSEVSDITNAVAEQIVDTVRPALRQLLDNHRHAGHETIVLSASPQPLVELVAAGLNADAGIGTRVEIVDGKLTGEMIPPFCYGAAKIDRLQDVLGPIPTDTVLYAYADSASDLPLLEIAEHRIVVTPDKTLRGIAESRGWSILDF